MSRHETPSDLRTFCAALARRTAFSLALGLAACTSGTTARVAPLVEQAELVSIVPQESWQDAILYFVILERFADGDPANNRDVDRRAKGTFHGGDLAGLRA